MFLPTLPYNDFMGLLLAADVVLDPFPFGGGVTTLDALAVGTYVCVFSGVKCFIRRNTHIKLFPSVP
jgi:predicted O-linked N-acetylglucosamine transferase (SPINDLY family)